MDVKRFGWFFVGLLLLTGCAVVRAPLPTKIALLAPFEGQYRAVGYNALYAARLALSENTHAQIDLLAIDDGGTAQRIMSRANAINQDDSIIAVIITGAMTRDTLQDFAWDASVIYILDESTSLEGLPDDFRTRYMASDSFAPEPTLLAWRTYQAMQAFLITQPVP